MNPQLTVRDLLPSESDALGRLLVEAYSKLEGSPTPAEQPKYYEMLANIGRFTEKPAARVLVAISPEGDLVGLRTIGRPGFLAAGFAGVRLQAEAGRCPVTPVYALRGNHGTVPT